MAVMAASKRPVSLLKEKLLAGDGRDFEIYVTYLFDRLPGWQATATPPSKDFGADIVAVDPNRVRYVIQTKHYKGKVGVEAVQQVVGAMRHYKAARAIVVTSGAGFTPAAKSLASSNQVVLWTLDELMVLENAVDQGLYGSLSRLQIAYSTSPSWLLFLAFLWSAIKRIWDSLPLGIWLLLFLALWFVWAFLTH